MAAPMKGEKTGMSSAPKSETSVNCSEDLLHVGAGSRADGIPDSLLLLKEQRFKTFKVEKSSVLSRAKAFLPELAKAQEKLNERIKYGAADELDIENIENCNEKIIEMNLAMVEQPDKFGGILCDDFSYLSSSDDDDDDSDSCDEEEMSTDKEESTSDVITGKSHSKHKTKTAMFGPVTEENFKIPGNSKKTKNPAVEIIDEHENKPV